MLAIFHELNRLEELLDDNRLINDFKILVKTDMEIEVYIKTNFPERIDTQAVKAGRDAINTVVVTERDFEYDPFYQHVFSDDFPRTDFGSVWRFDTLLESHRMETEKSSSQPSVVTFYSYKGGMGRTTALCAYAMHAALNRKRKVVVIDCDFEAPGYLNFFNLSERQKNGVVEYFLDKEFNGSQGVNIMDYLIPVDTRYAGPEGKIYVMPAGNLEYFQEIEQSGQRTGESLNTHLYHYIHGLARLNIGRTDQMLGRFMDLFDELTRALALTSEDYLLIDSRAGFNDIFGITALSLSDLIVGFFGSNEQTRPGLYFLLDEFYKLRADDTNPVRLVLVNSVIPRENSELFRNRFESFLREYESRKDVDGSVFTDLPLHENRVLKESGVRFYDDDDENRKKDDELVRLITAQRFFSAGQEEGFDDLRNLFALFDEQTGRLCPRP